MSFSIRRCSVCDYPCGSDATCYSCARKRVYLDEICESPVVTPHAWIQWKGTNVCMDVYCPCGQSGHVDAEFAYFYRCACGKRFAVGATVRLFELSNEDMAILNPDNNYETDDSPDEDSAAGEEPRSE